MSKTLVVFGSTTGNTETTAEWVQEALTEKGFEVELKNVAEVEAKDLGADHDYFLFGCSTWGEDEIELQDDFIPLYESLEESGLKGKKASVFGCGDSDYTYFCGAVDAIEEKLEQIGAIVVGDTLKIDGDPDRNSVMDWAKEVSAKL